MKLNKTMIKYILINQVNLMYKSFDNGKMTSTLHNLDLEELSFCLSCALMIHINEGDQ